MRFSRCTLPALLLIACRAPAPTGEGPTLQRFAYQAPAMGTLFRVALYAPNAAAAGRAADAALARLAEIEALASDYDPTSELSRLSRLSETGPTGWIAVSEELLEVLACAARISAASGGAFDVSVGPAVRLWRRARRQAELPSSERLAEATSRIGWEAVELDPVTRTARLARARMELDLGGIAKGYALDEMLRVLAAHGVERALIDGGGDVAASGPPPGEEGWLVALEHGLEGEGERGTWPGLRIAHQALATSGDAERYALIDGVRYSHIVDPRTGRALTRGTAASVLAPDGATADAWASALCVLGAGEGLERLAAAGQGLEGRVVESRPQGLVVRESLGLSRRLSWIPEAEPAAPETPSPPRDDP